MVVFPAASRPIITIRISNILAGIDGADTLGA